MFTNATRNKKLSKSWWSDFINTLSKDIHHVNILEILPKENISQLDFTYPSYYSDDIREIAAVIENSNVFIGADSGIMHLATSVNTPTIGLFNGTSNLDIYKPYGKGKHAIDTRESSFSEIITLIQKEITI